MTARTTLTRPTAAAGTHPGPARPGQPPAGGRRPTPRPAPTQLPPDEQRAAAERLAGALGCWYLDAQAGRRDVRQARGLLTRAAENRVAGSVMRARARRQAGERAPATTLTVRRVVLQHIAGHYEAIAMVDDGTRTLAVAAVLHPTAHGWRVSDLACPHDGLPAMAPPVMV